MADRENTGNRTAESLSRWCIPVIVAAFIDLFSVSFNACSSIECPVQNTVATVYELSDTLKDTLTVWTKHRNRKDTVLLNMKANPTKFELPVSYQNHIDTLLFGTRRLAVVDTVWLEKEDMPHFESVDCGVSYFHRLTSVRSTHLGIDTIVITKSYVDYDLSSAHLIITFKNRD